MTRDPKLTPSGISDAHYCAIGKVTANWAALEAIINSAIWQIGEIPDDIGACLTSQIFTYDAKIKTLGALLGVRGGLDATISALNKFHEEVPRCFACQELDSPRSLDW